MLFLAYDNARGDADLAYEGGTLLDGSAIETAALLSLFCDAPAREDDPVPEGSERRGFWADAYDGDTWGSRLWIVETLPVNRAVAFAPQAAEDALAWMVDDGLAESIDATAGRIGDHVRLTVMITKPGEVAPSLLGAWDLEVGDGVA